MPGAAWPPASPWFLEFNWWDVAGDRYSIQLSWFFDSPVNGGGTLALTRLDYDIDPNCPWDTIQARKPDGAIIPYTIPRTARTGSVTAAQLAAARREGRPQSPGTDGLTSFTDLGSITVYAS